MKYLRDLLIIGSIFGAIWFSASYLVGKSDDNHLVFDSDRQSVLADYVDDQMRSQYEIYSNDTLAQAIDKIVSRLDTSHHYKVIVLQSDELNAFATINGHIYLLTGLIKSCDSPEMLASVLSHEMGHLNHEHMISRLKKELGLSVLLSVATGGDPMLVSEIARNLLSMHFNREQERDADSYGRQLMIDAQIHPSHFAEFLDKLENQNSDYLKFLSTHPSSKERAHTNRSIPVSPSFKERKLDLDWDAVQRVIR